MNIEYFPEPKILLIYGHSPTAITHLRNQLIELVTERIKSVAVHELPGFRSINGCLLFAERHTFDSGTWPDPKQPIFRCRLRPNTWDNIEGLLEPFSASNINTGHQYLDNHGEVQWIISEKRAW